MGKRFNSFGAGINFLAAALHFGVAIKYIITGDLSDVTVFSISFTYVFAGLLFFNYYKRFCEDD